MKLFVTGISLFLATLANAEASGTVLSKKEYVDLWRSTSVQQMVQYKIPASITLAQGILESGNGNSELARKGNNHFGIKCHDWTGETMYVDDDKKGECFRVYKSAEESYIDHSLFLTTKKRYGSLFALPSNDYKAWAKGLSQAGYATNPKYPELLIGIIEELKLYELDIIGTPNNEVAPSLISEVNSTTVENANLKHTVQISDNKVKFIIARKGDTFYRISKEYGLGLWQLYKYNDFSAQKDVLKEGDIVYIQPKRRKSKKESINLTSNLTMREISQLNAVKLKSLMKLNDASSPDDQLSTGEKVTLR